MTYIFVIPIKKKREHSYKTFTAQNQLKVWFVKIKQRLNKRGIRFFYMKAEGRSFIKRKRKKKFYRKKTHNEGVHLLP